MASEMLRGRSANAPGELQIRVSKRTLLHILALNIECLTRRNLLGRLNLLEGHLGFGLGISCALEGLRKLELLRLRVTLQGLVFLDEILELLLDLIDPGLLLLALGAFLGCFVFGLSQRLLKDRHFGRAPIKLNDASFMRNHLSFITI